MLNLVHVSYLENEAFVGRFWGVVNRENLPYAPLQVRRVVGTAGLFHEMRRYTRRYWRGMSTKLQGFTLFVGSADEWLRLFEWMIVDDPFAVDRIERSSAYENIEF